MNCWDAPVDTPSARPDTEPLISDFADDQDIADLVDEFVDTLPRRVEAVEHALAHGDMGTLTTLVHQLKGAGGGFGFMPITDAARRVEAAAREHVDTDVLDGLITELGDLCRRASARG